MNDHNISARKIFIYCPLFLIIYNLAGNLSNDLYLPTLPALIDELHTTSFLVQFSMTIWFIGEALPQIYFGLIADKFGYKLLILWGGVIFLTGTFLCMITPSIYGLLAGRFFQGIGVSSLNIATFATVRSHPYEEKNSVKLISWINITGSLAPIMGPVIGSYLYLVWGWRSTFTCVLFLGSIALVGLYFFMIDNAKLDKELKIKINFRSSLQYYKPIYSNRNLWIYLGTYTCFLAALIAYLTSAPFVMNQQFHIPIQYFGVTQLVPFFSYIAGGITVNKLINTYSQKKIIVRGLIITFLSVCYFTLISIFSSWLTIYNYLLATSVFLYGFALAGSPLITSALSISENKGSSAAILGLSAAGMASLGSLMMATFYKGSFNVVAIIICTFILLGNLNYGILMTRRGKSHA